MLGPGYTSKDVYGYVNREGWYQRITVVRLLLQRTAGGACDGHGGGEVTEG